MRNVIEYAGALGRVSRTIAPEVDLQLARHLDHRPPETEA